MNAEDLEMNTVALVMSLDEKGSTIVSSIANFDDDLDEETEAYMLFLLRGLSMMAATASPTMAVFGSALFDVEELDSQEGGFEPADELLNKMDDAKVVSINGKKRLN
jgi:hypothetical protein